MSFVGKIVSSIWTRAVLGGALLTGGGIGVNHIHDAGEQRASQVRMLEENFGKRFAALEEKGQQREITIAELMGKLQTGEITIKRLNEKLESGELTIKDLSEKLQRGEITISQLNEMMQQGQERGNNLDEKLQKTESALQNLSKEVRTKKTPEEIEREILTEAKKSSVMLSLEGGAEWAGVIIKDNKGQYYILSCGHFSNTPDLVEHEITVRLFNDGWYKKTPQFKVLPSTLSDGTLPWLSHEDGDISFLILSDEEIKGLPAGVGLEVADSTEKLSAGDKVVMFGNPRGLRNSVYRTNIANPDREVTVQEGAPEQQQMQFATKLPKGMSGGPVFLLRTNGRKEGEKPKVIGIITWTFDKDPISFGHNPSGIKGLARKLGIPLMTRAEMLKEIGNNQVLLLGFAPQANPLALLPPFKLAEK